MRKMVAGLGIVVLVAMWAATPASAQTLQPGTWTGALTPPGGADVPVTFEVGETAGALSIVMNEPQMGGIDFSDVRLEGNELTFWWEPGVRVDCTLTRNEDMSFGGICSDGRGADGQGVLLMRPPA